LATATTSCPRCMVSTSSSATCTTSMRWRTPCHRNYPQAPRDRVGPRNLFHSWATDSDDACQFAG
jgi:hypothetical protein